MKKSYVSPVARIIELQMNENIAYSGDGELAAKFEFAVQVVNKCFEYVKGDNPSGYDLVSKEEFEEAIGNVILYAMGVLPRVYQGDNNKAYTVALQCSAAL